MKKHLIALDLDGTLLYDWTTLKTSTVKALKTLQDEGHTLVIATGRPFRSSERFYDMLGLKTPMINYNGGIITNKHDPAFADQTLWLEKDAILEVFKHHKDIILNAFCEIKDDVYLLVDDERLYDFLHLENGARLFVGPFEKTLPGPTNGFIIIAEHAHGEAIVTHVNEHYKGILLARNWGSQDYAIVELYTPKTNKGEALKMVASSLGFSLDDVIAFGDGINDFELIRTAGWGVAMKNAVEPLKALADDVTEHTNKEDGVIRYLNTYFNVSR